MNLFNKKLLIAAHYSAPYEGNFIASLKALKDLFILKFNGKCAFVFPISMKVQPWAEKFINDNIVFFTGEPSSSSSDVKKS